MPLLSEDIEALIKILDVDTTSALNKMRFITEKLLLTHARQAQVAWGDSEPTLERLIGPLVAAVDCLRTLCRMCAQSRRTRALGRTFRRLHCRSHMC